MIPLGMALFGVGVIRFLRIRRVLNNVIRRTHVDDITPETEEESHILAANGGPSDPQR